MRDRTKAILSLLIAVVVGVAAYLLLFPSSPTAYLVPPPAPRPPAVPCPSIPPITYGGGNATPPSGNWTTYHGDNTRTGVESGGRITQVRSQWVGGTGLDGQVYAEPLVCGNSVYVATENDSVYAVNAASGLVEWKTHLGTPVPGASLPCGDINPSGITGTPVIDVASSTLYLVAFLNLSNGDQHFLFGLNIATGAVTSQVAVDPTGATPQVEQERGALALANGMVYIPFGGLDGDCGNYHGWVVGVPTSPPATPINYEVPTGREGGIWSAAGITVAPCGDLYVSTGNGASSTAFDYGDSVIELSPSLQVLGFFAPVNWAQLNSGDRDLGSLAPTVLPDGDLFQLGKAGVGYLLSGTHLGGIGGQLYNASVCSGGYGGTAHQGQSVLVPCTNGLYDVEAGAASFAVAWHTSNFDSGSPIVTGDIVWAVNIPRAELLGFNLTTGQEAFSFPIGSAAPFISAAAAPGSLFVVGGTQLYGFALA